MSILRNLRQPERRSMELLSGASIPPPGFFYPTDSGATVNTDSAMRLDAVWACVNLLTDIVAPLPWKTYRENPDGLLDRVRDPLLITDPSNEIALSGADWRGQVMRSWLLRGNAYGLVKELGPQGEPTKIQIIHPDYVNVVRLGPLGPFEYRVLGEMKELFPAGDLIHMPGGYAVPGTPVGLSPIDYARQTIGVGLAAEEYAARFYGDSAIPSGILHTDQGLTGEQATAMKARFNEAVKGRREVAVLGSGMSFSPISVSSSESQWLETSKVTATRIARIFGVPPEMIGAESGSSMTYANVESRFLNLLTLAGRPWIVRLEHALSNLLPGKQMVRADVDELLRTDIKTRVTVQEMRLRSGSRSVNEVRREDNLAPIDGGDEYLWPPFALDVAKEKPIEDVPQDTEEMVAND
jgi:HK97 family phage portal protein